jgi:NAD(P) transhydrogenase subunit alpha
MKERKRYLSRSIINAVSSVVVLIGIALAAHSATTTTPAGTPNTTPLHGPGDPDYWGMVFVFMLSAFVGLGVIRRVSRLLYTPLMSLTNAISAIAVVGAILVAGPNYPIEIQVLGLIALFASVTNIVSGFLITDRMLKMFKRD